MKQQGSDGFLRVMYQSSGVLAESPDDVVTICPVRARKKAIDGALPDEEAFISRYMPSGVFPNRALVEAVYDVEQLAR